MSRNQTGLNTISADMEDVWIAQFPISKQKKLEMKQKQYMKTLTIGFNALNTISELELDGMGALERLVIMQGGLYDGNSKLQVVNCTNLSSIDIGVNSFMKYKYLELFNLPMLQTIRIGQRAFQMVYSIVMDSKRVNNLMNKICLHFS